MASADIEIWDEDKARWWPFSLVNQWDGQDGSLRPKIVIEELFSSDEGSDISHKLQPDVQEDWTRGIGLDYDWAPGLYTRSPGYVCPAGSPTEMVLPAGREDAGKIVDQVDYAGDIWFAQLGTATKAGAILRSVGGTAAITDATPAGAALAAGDYVRGLVVASNDLGEDRLYVMVSDGGVANGRMLEYDANTTTWTWTAVGALGPYGRGPATKVFWTTSDGTSASRIVTISGPRFVSYTRPFGDPMDPAQWVEGVKIAGTRGQLRSIAAAATHVYLSAEDGLFDLQETGESPNLMSYIEGMYASSNGLAVQYHDGAVFYSLAIGIDRIMVEQQGVLQEHPGQCAPGWGTRVENPVMGWASSFCVDQGYLVAAIFNPVLRRTYVCWGKSRQVLGIESPNPMIWYGPEVVIHGNKTVSSMSVSSLTNAQRWLWMSIVTDTNSATTVIKVPLPVAGSPLQDLYSIGSYRFNRGLGDTGDYQPVASLYQLPNTWKDKPSKKIIHEHAVGSRALEGTLSGTRLVEYDRADPDPGSTTWPTGTTITDSPVQIVQPTTTTSGYELGRRVDFISPSGTSSPPRGAFLNSLRTTAWKVAPSFMVRALTLQHGTGVMDRGLSDAVAGQSIDPESVVARLLAIINDGGLTRIRDARGRRKNVRIQQVLQVGHTYLDHSPQQALEIKIELVVLSSIE